MGSKFVAFSTPKDTCRVLLEMVGKIIAEKPLYICCPCTGKRKEEQGYKHNFHNGACMFAIPSFDAPLLLLTYSTCMVLAVLYG